MSRAPDDAAPGGVPPSIGAIMASIRREVAAPPAGPGAIETAPRAPDPSAPPPAPRPPAPAEFPPLYDIGDPDLSPQLDANVRALLAPLLEAWLDAHLPEIVEAAVATEIRRLTGQG